MREERIREIESYLKERELCRLDDLSEKFNVSKVTIRRDIEILCEMGIAEKVYGGIKVIKKAVEPTIPYLQREVRCVDEKEYIGRLAASLVRDGDTVFIDSGTTTIRLINYLEGKKINVITNNLNVILTCLSHKNINIISTGGEYSHITNSLVGELALAALEYYNISKAFVATTGVSTDFGFSNSSALETALKKTAIARSNEKYIMLDHEKWNKVSLTTFSDLFDISGIVTDKRPPENFVKLFEENNILVMH